MKIYVNFKKLFFGLFMYQKGKKGVRWYFMISSEKVIYLLVVVVVVIVVREKKEKYFV